MIVRVQLAASLKDFSELGAAACAQLGMVTGFNGYSTFCAVAVGILNSMAAVFGTGAGA